MHTQSDSLGAAPGRGRSLRSTIAFAGTVGDKNVRVGDVFRAKSDADSQQRAGMYASRRAAQCSGEQRVSPDSVPCEYTTIDTPRIA